MSNIDKQALREAAEKATPGRVGDRIDGSGSIKYECHGYDGSLVLRTDHKNMEYGFIGDNSNADELFFRLCVPDVILALLDELEAAEKRIAELERKEQHSDRQSVIDALASSGEEWSDIEEYMQKWDAERAAAAGKGE
ncbi:TPA: ead/Ea22-like family protein [Escherichia coli]|nr:ead/Ea22-like family protein [Escherichia coli]